MAQPVNVICAKWGEKYGAEYVRRLHSMVARHLTIPFRFVCFTDGGEQFGDGIETMQIPPLPLPDSHKNLPWRKIGLFAPELGDLQGATLFLDLDLVIVDNINSFFDYKPGEFCIIHNWNQPGKIIGNSSVYRFEVGADAYVYQNLHDNMAAELTKYPNSQTYLSHTIKQLNYWPDAWCKSFKFHCVPKGILRFFVTAKKPEGCKIVVFHGHPNPDEVAIGKWKGFGFPKGVHKYIKPVAWVADNWR